MQGECYSGRLWLGRDPLLNGRPGCRSTSSVEDHGEDHEPLQKEYGVVPEEYYVMGLRVKEKLVLRGALCACDLVQWFIGVRQGSSGMRHQKTPKSPSLQVTLFLVPLSHLTL